MNKLLNSSNSTKDGIKSKLISYNDPNSQTWLKGLNVIDSSGKYTSFGNNVMDELWGIREAKPVKHNLAFLVATVLIGGKTMPTPPAPIPAPTPPPTVNPLKFNKANIVKIEQTAVENALKTDPDNTLLKDLQTELNKNPSQADFQTWIKDQNLPYSATDTNPSHINFWIITGTYPVPDITDLILRGFKTSPLI